MKFIGPSDRTDKSAIGPICLFLGRPVCLMSVLALIYTLQIEKNKLVLKTPI